MMLIVFSQPASSHKKKKLVKRSDMASASAESTKKSEKPTGSATKGTSITSQ